MKLYQQDPATIDYCFEDQVNPEPFDDGLIFIAGNPNFREYGDDKLISIITGDYEGDELGYNYNIIDALIKVTGKNWKCRSLVGYSQSDWQYCYFAEGVSESTIDEIENFYMGKVDSFVDEDNTQYLVPHNISWEGRIKILEYLGFDKDTEVFEFDGYIKTPKYTKMD